ncbi:MAG: fibronectin type III domain-containing protein [Clostridiales bacterium]|nr:fibronectin type III domain-containing protein [Clostridiales bacterium]
MKKVFTGFLAAASLIACLGMAVMAKEPDGSTAGENVAPPVATEDVSDDVFLPEATKTIKVNTDIKDHFADGQGSAGFFYRFTLDAPGKVQVVFKHDRMDSDPIYWRISLLNDEGNYITSGDKAVFDVRGQQMTSYLPSIGLPKGTYGILITYGTHGTDQEYTLRVNYTKSSVWETENNDSAGKADPISVNKKYYGTVLVKGDLDYYKFTIADPGKVQVHFNHDNVGDWYDCWKMTFIKADGQSNAFDKDAWETFTGDNEGGYAPSTGLKAGTYYLLITSGRGTNGCNYSFTINYTKSTIWEAEANSSRETARTIATNQKYYGSIYAENDVDWYKFTVPVQNDVTINFTHPENKVYGARWNWELYKEGVADRITGGGINGDSQFQHVEKSLKGTYYLKISSASMEKGITNGTYVLEIKDVPTTPTSVKAATASITSVKVSWAKVNTATGYEVWRSETANGTFKKVGTTTALSYTNGSLTTGKKYYYKVRAYKTANSKTGYSDFSSVVSATATLPVPSSVMAKVASPVSVNITWTPGAGTDFIQVWRASKANAEQKDYVLIGTYKASAKSSVSKFLTPNNTYYYKLRGYKKLSNGKTIYSGYSKIASAKPSVTVGVPTGLTVTGTTPETISLTWNKISGSNIMYEVWRMDVKGHTPGVCIGRYDTNSCTSKKLTPGKTYYYRVRAYYYFKDANGDTHRVYGNYTSIKEATTPKAVG